MPDLNQVAPLVRADAKAASMAKMADKARTIVRAAVEGRKSLADRAEQILDLVNRGTVETYELRIPQFDLLSSGSYKDFSSDANFFYPWKNGSNQRPQTAGEVLIWTWFGFDVNHDIQAASLAELVNNGSFIAHYGDGKRPEREIPLISALISRMAKVNAGNNAGAVIDGQSLPVTSGQWFAFDRDEPLVVIPGDSQVYVRLNGLSGTAAGSSPAIKLTPYFRGLRIRA